MNKELNAQVCDATDDEQRTKARPKKIAIKKMNEATNTKTFSNPPFGGRGGFIIAGGGTGGHIFPAIAIANALKEKQPQLEILFVGANGKMEMEKVPKAGYNIKGIDIAGFNRSSLLKNISLPFKLIKSFGQVKKIISDFKPAAVIGVGGYSSFPVLRYAQSKGIKTFIHESNSFAGKSNILLGKKAARIFTGTAGMEKFFPAEKIIVTGNPVRKNIVQPNVSREEAIEFFGLDAGKKIILATGGSLGARSINEAIASKVHELESLNLQLIWQTGKTTAQAYIDRGKGYKTVWVNDFIEDMGKAYAAADVVISRAGAMSVAEICVAKKPAVFVPYPHAAEDHQTMNAKFLVDKDAALMVKDSDVKARLFGIITNLANDTALQDKRKKNIAAYAITNADDRIADEVLSYMQS